MNITILTYGSRGDVAPCVALGRGLRRAGYAVRLAAPAPFEALATAHDLDFASLPGDPERMVRRLTEAGRSGPRMAWEMARFVAPLGARVFKGVRAACRGTEAVVHTFLTTTAGHEVAAALGIPELSAQFFPVFTATGAFPAPAFPDLPLGRRYRRLTHHLVTQTFWQGSRALYRRVRRAHPHLPPLTGWPFAARGARAVPVLYAFSPQVVPPPADWPAHAHVTGYWFPAPPDGWEPPRALLDFLAAGPPPVAVSFGSIVTADPGALRDTVVEALAQSGERGVLVGGQPPCGAPAERVFHLEHVPHGWLFPRTRAVVHHGGAGTTAQALRAGVPHVVVPFTTDQPFWARRVHALSVGPRPIPRARLTAARLAEAIATAVGDETVRASAQALGRRIRAEDGVARAVELIARHLETS
jgi:sterol 3beta-glucosyltransferase